MEIGGTGHVLELRPPDQTISTSMMTLVVVLSIVMILMIFLIRPITNQIWEPEQPDPMDTSWDLPKKSPEDHMDWEESAQPNYPPRVSPLEECEEWIPYSQKLSWQISDGMGSSLATDFVINTFAAPINWSLSWQFQAWWCCYPKFNSNWLFSKFFSQSPFSSVFLKTVNSSLSS